MPGEEPVAHRETGDAEVLDERARQQRRQRGRRDARRGQCQGRYVDDATFSVTEGAIHAYQLTHAVTARWADRNSVGVRHLRTPFVGSREALRATRVKWCVGEGWAAAWRRG